MGILLYTFVMLLAIGVGIILGIYLVAEKTTDTQDLPDPAPADILARIAVLRYFELKGLEADARGTHLHPCDAVMVGAVSTSHQHMLVLARSLEMDAEGIMATRKGWFSK